ncbi:proton-translocating NADH-ubiquinone oxidoreductase, chain l [Heliomicrobium modesticaldum Ice1]|uniref:Proton-translocating NADH-ubiquinone oxidoreductase, chain l n=1 Tax=Heliobacterium modesticaldum (strain ATCC 51547 / Ice1) TaxID=498761 RepID=B0TH85_HELMI|nr:NADH-quinone oxidoreductase subunit L [Heliomicrobium modesticaldum]ABZ84760.1 proton-translocating NADH-ubiquinone oxidoreductase, chain l [Heliomicrobium modesticaldum Ice1]
MDFALFSLNNAWLIPLLPFVAFVLIAFPFKNMEKTASTTAILFCGASFLLSLGVVAGILQHPELIEQPFIKEVRWFSMPGLSITMGQYIDPISAMMLFVVTLVATMVMIYSTGYMHGDPGYTRFFAYLSLFACSMLGLVIATNLLQMFIFWELVGLCSYLLIGYYYFKDSAREAAKKAFMTTRIGDFGLLLGIMFLQINFGTLEFAELADKLPAFALAHPALITLIGILVFIGPIGKSGQFPLHVWLPDAMEGPSPVSALIHAATMVVAGVYLVARAFTLFQVAPEAQHFVAYIGGFTAFFAASIALTQREMKRILAYSTVSQLGYMMMALGVGSLTASMFHLMTHAFFKALMFLAAGSALHALHGTADIFEMGGLRKKMPWTAAFMVIGTLAIAGIPPFAGFWSKDEILLMTKLHGFTDLYILASLTAFMTAFYMSRMVFVAFFGKENPKNHPHESPWNMILPMAVLAVLAIVGGLVGTPWTEHGFGYWVRYGEYHHPEVDWSVMGGSVVLAVAGISLAWAIYGAKLIDNEKLARRAGILYTLSYRKFFIDEIYQAINKTLVAGTARFLYWVDIHIVDGFIDGLADGTGWAGRRLRRVQTGQLQHYAMIFFFTVVLMAVMMGLMGNHSAMALIGGGK